MAEPRLKVNRKALVRTLKTAPVRPEVLEMAVRVRDAANRWADSYPRSEKHPVQRPHFVVVTEPGEHRTRYTVRPASAFATWLVQHDPHGFMACLEAGRR
ncbi:hypothetical protein [Acidipropionibacterium timonense]|uniref:hypothetical protein n=1 Tax=Acidipropionibacterium timonense TaxID=2161818 RepID=UPI00102F9454|nr:hypothetical protein [Acidipropionibacterium timonense]